MPAMSDGGFRLALDGIEAQLAAGEQTAGAAALAYVAAQLLSLDESELAAARRRALFVLAAGGDPHRELELESPAVDSLARDLDSPDLRADLRRVLTALSDPKRPASAAAIARLVDDEELALLTLAAALLAEELADEN